MLVCAWLLFVMCGCGITPYIILIFWVMMAGLVMAGRNGGVTAAINRLIAAMNRAQPTDDMARRLEMFEKRNPPHFKGGFDPEGAQRWIREIEKNFRVVQCEEAEKVTFTTYNLVEEAEDWWDGQRCRLEADRVEITWDLFRERFLGKYFPENVRERKEVEHFTLVQGSMSVGE